MRSLVYAVLNIILLCTCEVEVVATSGSAQSVVSSQGIQMQGIQMQGINMQGINMQGFRLDGARLSTNDLTRVRVSRGEVLADLGEATLRGDELVGAEFEARVKDLDADPPVTSVLHYKITAVVEETDVAYDPTGTGHTFLYSISQWVPDTASWEPACLPDADDARVAIPIDAWWDEEGDRFDSSDGDLFTFGCTTGVIAKCYRWGYRPWVSGHGDLEEMHWACTRMARADYCGDGRPHTHDGTLINVWDTLPSVPIQTRGVTPGGMGFEAAWTTAGAVCVHHTRYALDPGLTIGTMCSDAPMATCDDAEAALEIDATTRLFNESVPSAGP